MYHLINTHLFFSYLFFVKKVHKKNCTLCCRLEGGRCSELKLLLLQKEARSNLNVHVHFTLQGRSQYEANRGTCLSHLRFDPGSVLFKRSHHKDPE